MVKKRFRRDGKRIRIKGKRQHAEDCCCPTCEGCLDALKRFGIDLTITGLRDSDCTITCGCTDLSHIGHDLGPIGRHCRCSAINGTYLLSYDPTAAVFPLVGTTAFSLTLSADPCGGPLVAFDDACVQPVPPCARSLDDTADSHTLTSNWFLNKLRVGLICDSGDNIFWGMAIDTGFCVYVDGVLQDGVVGDNLCGGFDFSAVNPIAWEDFCIGSDQTCTTGLQRPCCGGSPIAFPRFCIESHSTGPVV